MAFSSAVNSVPERRSLVAKRMCVARASSGCLNATSFVSQNFCMSGSGITSLSFTSRLMTASEIACSTTRLVNCARVMPSERKCRAKSSSVVAILRVSSRNLVMFVLAFSWSAAVAWVTSRRVTRMRSSNCASAASRRVSAMFCPRAARLAR